MLFPEVLALCPHAVLHRLQEPCPRCGCFLFERVREDPPGERCLYCLPPLSFHTKVAAMRMKARIDALVEREPGEPTLATLF